MPGRDGATPPAHLSESAQRAWVEVVADLGVSVDGVESPALESYAVAIGRMRDAQHRIDTEGMIVADDKGRPSPHPALAIEKAASAEVKRWLERYRQRPKRGARQDEETR
jgi:P27 family predicted phage terminase small subunit